MARKNKNHSDTAGRVAIGVAAGSLLLNVVQFYFSRSEKGQERQDKQAEQRPEALFAYADDQTLSHLYDSKLRAGNSGMSAFSIRRGGPTDEEIREWLGRLGSGSEGAPRSKPVASFLVVGNRLDRAVRNIRAVVPHSRPAADSVLLSASLLEPKEYVFVPLDFRRRGNDSAEPEIPAEVRIEYEGGLSYSIRPQDRVTWLSNQFLRGLVRSFPGTPK